MHQQRQHFLRLIKLIVIVLACAALVDGVVTALAGQLYGNTSLSDGSIDFQWSPSRVLLQGTDPFKLFLELDAQGLSKSPESPFILAQRASYPASSLIFLWPYAFFEWSVAKILWLITNLLSGIAIIIGVIRLAKLQSQEQIFWLAALFVTGLPFRHTIGNGQHGLFCLAFFIWAVIWAERNRMVAGLLLAISWVKYTITMPLALFFLTSRRRFSVLIITGLIHVGLTLFASFWVSSSVVDILLDPLRVASTNNQGVGDLDLFSVVERLGYSTAGWPVVLSLLVFLATVVVALRTQTYNDFLLLVVLSLVVYILPRHKQYDLVVLVLPLAYAIKHYRTASGMIVGGLIGLTWFGRKGLEILDSTIIGSVSSLPLETMGFILTGVLYYGTTAMMLFVLWQHIQNRQALESSNGQKAQIAPQDKNTRQDH
ncbi:MAG: glycosyltransferase family 87 protein [Chloroflexota bacterium]